MFHPYHRYTKEPRIRYISLAHNDRHHKSSNPALYDHSLALWHAPPAHRTLHTRDRLDTAAGRAFPTSIHYHWTGDTTYLRCQRKRATPDHRYAVTKG